MAAPRTSFATHLRSVSEHTCVGAYAFVRLRELSPTHIKHTRPLSVFRLCTSLMLRPDMPSDSFAKEARSGGERCLAYRANICRNSRRNS